MIKEMFSKKKEEVVQPRVTAVVNPNEIPMQETIIETQRLNQPVEQEEQRITNLIVSSEALDNGTFRYVMVSNMIYPIGSVDVEIIENK